MRMMRSVRAAVVAASVIALLASFFPRPYLPHAAGQEAIRVTVNGQEVAFDVPPVELGGRLLVPLRGVFERLGATVLWEPAAQRITARTASRTIELAVGRREASVDGRLVLLDVPPTVIEGRTFVPLRFVSEAIGAYVQWQAATRTVSIVLPSGGPPPAPGQPTPPPPPPPTPAPSPTPTPTPPPTPTPTPTPAARATEGVLITIAPAAVPPRVQVMVGSLIYIFVITPETTISRFDAATGAGGSVALGALRVGDQVRVEAVAGGNQAASVRASYRLLRGQVDILTATAIALLDGTVVRINSDATITVAGASLPLGDAPARVRRGDEATVRTNPVTGEAWELTVTRPAGVTPTPTPTAGPGPRTVAFTASFDAPLIEASPGIAHPMGDLVVGRDASGRYRSVLWFNPVLPSGATVRRATLRLYVHGLRTGGTDIYTAFLVTRAWTETNATWNSLATSYALLRPAGTVTVGAGAAGGYAEWNVTEFVRAWIEGTHPNYGILLRNLESGANVVQFGGRRDAPAQRPRLEVEFSTP